MDVEEDQQEVEFAIANHVRVLETNVLHASDVIYWLDGVSASSTSEMERLNLRLELRFSGKPRDVSVRNSAGKTAFWRQTSFFIIDGDATEVQRARPPAVLFNVIGEAWDRSRRYNPVAFDSSLGAGSGQGVVVYPSPLGTQIPMGGAILGTALLDTNQAPVIWGLVELEITVSVSQTLVVRAQTDANGDFVIPLKRLPPLPESVTEYTAQLSLRSQSTNSAEAAPDLTTYSDVQLESMTIDNDFNNALTLSVRPGERARIRSSNKNYLAVA